MKHKHSGCSRKSLENPRQVLLSAGIEDDSVLLDIGTGSGYLAVTAAEIMGNGSKVYALDDCKESIDALNKELVKNNIMNVTAVKADAVKEIPLQKSSIDACLMSNVVHGFAANAEMGKVMKNVNLMLKQEGKIIVIDFVKGETSFGPPLSVRLSPEEVGDIIAPFGYKIINQFDAGPYHYCIVFKRINLQDRYC